MKRYLVTVFTVCSILRAYSQSGMEFWFAPPEVTFSHNSPGGVPIYLNISTFNDAATVTIDQPANGSFTPIVIAIPANSSHQEDLSAFVADLETAPTDAVLTTGLRIIATDTITAYYEVSNTNNTDIFALKGKNSLGKEFYVPLQNHSAFWNHNTYSSPNLAYASFDIVATQNATTVLIYPPVDVDGHAAFTPFSVSLDQGETYSCGWTGTDYHLPSNHPSGAVIVSDKDIAVTIKDDSDHNPSGGCYDLMGDQIVPIEIVGTEYIAVKGQLNNTGDESVFILATENNTKVYIDGSTTPLTTLFAGQTYRYDMDYLDASSDNSVYIVTSKPAYVTHVTGFGCEQGQAILPPLGCAGSEQIAFTRSTSESFFLNILVRTAAVNDFNFSGPGTGTISPASFLPVPGTGGQWMSANIQYNTTEVPVNQAHLVTNSSDVFSLAIINGGGSSGCRYGFFSEFAAEILIDAGIDATVCANDTAQLSGSVDGGTTTGQWSTSGSGQFLPSDTDLNAEYVPSPADISAGILTITLTSTGNCTPVSDNMTLNITPAPTVDAGTDVSRCENNSSVNLVGTVTIASGGIWSGGTGSYSPNNTSLATVYTPSAAEITAGFVTLTLTTTGNGICNQETDNITITISPAPTVDAGVNQSVCSNNSDASLNGSITVASGGIWSGGTGTFSPNINALNATYTPSPGELTTGFVTLTLTTTGNGNCTSESDNVTLTYTASPTVNAGTDQTVCANNADATLNGSVTISTGGSWSGGLGTFTPNNTTLNAIYSPTASEVAAGTVTLILTSTGNGNCNAVIDDMTINFTTAPTTNAGLDQTVCANSPDVTLNGSVTVATGGVWSGGTGLFTPNANTLNATYTPSAAEITAGTVTLTFTTTGNGTCNAETDDVTINITPAPTVNAGVDQSVCSNNSDATLNGAVTVATGGIWSGGAGSFSPNVNALNATYTPSAGELTTGFVTLTLTTTGNGTCTAEDDTITITYTTAPTANANADQTVCANNADVTLNGSVTIASGGSWSGGLGTFTPNNTTLNATYSPTAAEITAGSVTLTLATTGNGTCNAVIDDMTINFTTAPTTNAGLDQTVCANSPDVTLNGSVTVATGGVWSGGTGLFTPNANTVNATYTPSAAEIIAGTVALTLTTTGNGTCTAETDDMTITIDPSPVVSAGPGFSVCANNPDVTLNGSINFAGGGSWSGGTGTFNPSNTALNATYTPTPAEITTGTVTLLLTSTGNGLCTAESDSTVITITPAPIVNAGPDQSVCANNSDIALSGSITGAGGGQWTGGLGVFTPDNTTLNASYTPTTTEIASGTLTLTLTSTGNGNCNSESDDILITFTTAPTVDAGTDVSICANNSNVTLSGNVTIASGGVWLGGTGSFNPSATDLNAIYTPSPAEITAGSTTLTLQTTGNGNCTTVSDDVVITIDPEPTTNAGPNSISCENNPTINLFGSVTNATGGVWSGGTGFFNASTTDLNAVYTPSPAEITAGSVTLTLTSTGNPSCAATSDSMNITIVNSPTADAGSDQSICGNNADITLTGSVLGSSGGQWTGGLGIFAPSNNALNAVYTPTAGEISSGTLTLTLTTTGNGTCNAVSDNMTITFTSAPTADAGGDITVCENNSMVSLGGSVTIASGAIWSGGNGIFTPSSSDLNATYAPTTSEITAGSLLLALTTTGNGNCNAETDSVAIIIDPVPNVDAGTDQLVCVNDLTVNLSGSVSGITNTGQWSTSGSGIFVPNSTTLNADYLASSADSITGMVTLTLQSTNNSTCLPTSDDMMITILPAGVADAGQDITVCANNSTISLNGTVTGGATSGVWTSTGTGIFVPNDSTLNATYVPSANDESSGSITLTLTANSCDLDSDDMIVTITPEPLVDAGIDQTVCASNLNILLTGSVIGASTTGIWSTSGTGTFSPNNTDLTATYMASSADSIAHGVTIVLSATGIGNCVPVTDTLLINIFPTGTVDAGMDQTVCANNSTINLNGIISGGASEGVWTTSGSGTFTPNDTVLNATYVPSIADTIAGMVNLTLTATNSCNITSDFIVLTLTPAPFVDAGSSQSMCGTNPVVSLLGIVNGATSGQWTTNGTGTFSPSDVDLNATYTASPVDITSGSITIYLNSIGNGSCNAVIDSTIITISSGITVNAGPDQTVCSTADFTLLTGSVTNGSTSGVWSTLGSGTFQPSDSVLITEYHFSSSDTTIGNVSLVLTSTNNGSCTVETDTVTITFGNTAYVNAGSDQIVCASNADVNLNGLISGGASEGIWNTLGSGNFSPSDTVLNAIYSPSATDSINGLIELVLLTTDHGSCLQGRDTMTIRIDPVSNANAGADIIACATVDSIQLSGTVTNATGGLWASNGTGSFYPNDSTLTCHYLPSSSDLTAGSVQLYLTTTGTLLCSPVSDTITINFITPLTVDFTHIGACVGMVTDFTDGTTINNGSISSWIWNFDDGDSSNAQSPSHTYATAGTYDVDLIVFSSLGCSYQITQTVTINATPIAGFTAAPSQGQINGPVTFSDLSSGATLWNWNFGDGTGASSGEQNPRYTYSSEGNFVVTQVVSNAFGCMDSTTGTLLVSNDQLIPPAVPTGFSPNGDGENDVLYVLGGPFERIELRVFNNWGNLIFESTKENSGWDGSWDGKIQAAGDYIYTVMAITADGKVYEKYGSVSIIK